MALSLTSHPSRVRGLKHDCNTRNLSHRAVAPFTGAWIETVNKGVKLCSGDVAPFTGAWIETSATPLFTTCAASHPSRVRGLKPTPYSLIDRVCRSHPSRVRGLKQDLGLQRHELVLVAPFTGAWIETIKNNGDIAEFRKSHPSRVRGLKLFSASDMSDSAMSHPSRVRGLKPPHAGTAPFT